MKRIILTGLFIVVIISVVIIYFEQQFKHHEEFPDWMFKEPTLEDEWVHEHFITKSEYWTMHQWGRTNDGRYLLTVHNEISRSPNHWTTKFFPRLIDLENGTLLWGTTEWITSEKRGNGITYDEKNHTIYPNYLPPSLKVRLQIINGTARKYYFSWNNYTIEIEAVLKGIPQWYGTTDLENMTSYRRVSEDIWLLIGGFAGATETVKMSLTTPNDQHYDFLDESAGINAHLWMYPDWKGEGSKGSGRTALSAVGKDFYLLFHHEVAEGNITYNTASLGFSDGKFYRFTDWKVEKFGDSIYSYRYTFKGTFEDGTIDLDGRVVGYPDYNWGYFSKTEEKLGIHPYVHWTGTITRDGKIIDVDAYGTGENLWIL